jgi:hypothetical protein
MRRVGAVLGVVLAGTLLAAAANAVPVLLRVEPTLSTIEPTSDAATPLDGTILAAVGSLPPNAETVTFDLLDIDVDAGDLRIALNPTLANPALGVLNAAGSFWIPNLHLRVFSATSSSAQFLTLTDVMGTFGPSASCESALCLDTQFQIETGLPQGTLDVTLHAYQTVPEPTSWALLILGLALASSLGRSREEII